MTPVQAALLGILQGLTEFLPVSSSGHLVLAQSLIPLFSQPGVLFDAVLHAGTLVAVLVFFRKQILALNTKMMGLLVVGTIPVAVAGILLQSQIEVLFSTPKLVGAALLVTGVMNWLVDRNYNQQQTTKGLKWGQVLVIGIFQAVALVPGISRSGATIFAGVAQGVKKEEAATFSFLLSIPAVAGATLLQLVTHGQNFSLPLTNYVVGFVVAAIVGYVTIGFLFRLLLARRFKVFAIYCFALGLTAIFISG